MTHIKNLLVGSLNLLQYPTIITRQKLFIKKIVTVSLEIHVTKNHITLHTA